MGRRPDEFTPGDIEPRFRDLDLEGTLYVALSGGADSTALLVALQRLDARPGKELVAVHVNHGAHPDAPAWAEHCARLCDSLGVPLRVLGPPQAPLGPGSPEARMRQFRYDGFERLLRRGDALCTAHHREDQSETLLLALLRGSGPAGLSAMPFCRPLGQGLLLRPLLDVPGASLQRWLRREGFDWLTDPTNAEIAADRNFLRREVLPKLRERWPATDKALATAAALQAEQLELLTGAALLALAGRCPAPGLLDLRGLDPASMEFRAVVRQWLRQAGTADLPRRRLVELGRQLSQARPDHQCHIAWGPHTIRHYRGVLWLDRAASPAGDEPWPERHWNTANPLVPAGALGALRLQPGFENGDNTPAPTFLLRARHPGDRIRPAPGRPSTSLKRWLSASALPPWFRDAVPVIPGRDGIAALGDHVLDPQLRERLDDLGQAICWQPGEPALEWAWAKCRATLLRLE